MARMRKFHVLVLAGLMSTEIFAARTYHAHPEKDFDVMEHAQANFLVTEALHRIALAYDSQGEEGREAILSELLNDDMANAIHNLKHENDYDEMRLEKLGRQVQAWLRNFPRSSVTMGEKSYVDYTTEQLLRIAHRLSRLAYKFAGLKRPETVLGVLNETVHGPNLIYQNDQVKVLNQAMNMVCSETENKLDENASGVLLLGRKFLQYAPDIMKAGAERVVLGAGKSCETLANDVMGIVRPHLGILRAKPTQLGQLEGLSIYMVNKLFSKKTKPLESPLTKMLLGLEKVEHLNKHVQIYEAVAQVLGIGARDGRLIHLFGLAGHNHGLETYVLKLALDFIDDREIAVETALRLHKAIDHLYGLIRDHKARRKAIGGKDILTTAKREYHYWGGALMACELVKRGYNPWISEKVSATLGAVYEQWTKTSSGEGVASSEEDVKLHISGSKDWLNNCH